MLSRVTPKLLSEGQNLTQVSGGGHVDNNTIRCGLADKLLSDQIHPKIVVDREQITILVDDKCKLHF